MKKPLRHLLAIGSVLLTFACSANSPPPTSRENRADDQSLAAHCGTPSVEKLQAIASRFDPKFKNEALLDAFSYRIDDKRSVVSATVKRPTESHPGTPTAWLMSEDTVVEQLTGSVDLSNPLGDFVAPPPPLPGGNAQQWEFEWRDCDSIVPRTKRSSWLPPRSTDLADAPPKCNGAEPLDKMPGTGFELKTGYKLIDIYRAYNTYPRSPLIGGNVVDSDGGVVARAAVWQIGDFPRSANHTAAKYSDYRMIPSYNIDTEKVTIVEQCANAVHH